MGDEMVGTDVWVLRVKPHGARAVHAGKTRPGLGGRTEVTTACREWFVDFARLRENGRVLSADTKVTCQGCVRRMARPLTRSEVMAFEMQARAPVQQPSGQLAGEEFAARPTDTGDES